MSRDNPRCGNARPWSDQRHPSRVAAGLSSVALHLPAACALALAGLLALPGCATWSFLWYRLAPDYPPTAGQRTQRLPGLDAPVTVHFDALGVPHLRAGSERDLVAAVGYLHGRDRYFQLDMLRRFARGRLAELVGEQPSMLGTTLESDLFMRGWGFEDAARADVANLTAAEAELLERYAAGVNAALAAHEPLEYRLLRVAPEPWRPLDTFAIARLVSWSVSHNWQQELVRLLLALQVGPSRADQLYPGEPFAEHPALPPLDGPARVLPDAIPAASAQLLTEWRAGRAPARAHAPRPRQRAGLPPAAGASNAWVIGGARTRSGLPIVANDPHLSHLLPSLLYQQHLVAPGLDVIGATIPGLPYVLFGRTAEVAWGITSAVADTLDLYLERPAEGGADLVAGPDGPLPLERVTLDLRVRVDGELRPAPVTIRRSRHGPLLNDIYPSVLPADAPLVAIAWDQAPCARCIEGLAAINRARSVAELRARFADLTFIAQVVNAADASGAIALFATGRIPVRAAHRGTFPAPGWLSDYDWQGFYDPALLPQAVGGPSERFAHGNNLLRDPRHDALLYHVDSAPSFRHDRILALIDAASDHTTDSVAAMQTDVYLLRAERLLPHLLADLCAMPSPSAAEHRGLELLATWDRRATADSAAAAIFWATYRAAVSAASRDEVPPEALEFFLSQRYSTNAWDLWFQQPLHPAWDDRRTPAVETRATALAAAYREALAWLSATLGPDPDAWRWGAVHDVHFTHPFGGREALAGLLNLPPAEAAGGPDSVWKSHFDLGHPRWPLRAMAGPVYRSVVDLADARHGRWVLDTGTSGWPGSPHYGDQHALWKRGALAPMVSDLDEVAAGARGVLTLEP